MSIDLLRQNTETLVELANNYNKLSNKKNMLLESINAYKVRGAKREQKKAENELEDINQKLKLVKDYLLKLVTKMDKLIEEEKNVL